MNLKKLLALLLALALIAAACGSTDETAEGTADEDASASESSDDDAGESSGDDSEGADGFGTIDYLGWEGYDTFFGATEDVLTDLGIDFNSTAMAAPSDIAQRFASGGGEGIDLLAWTSSNHAQYRAVEGALCPIAPDEIPNVSGLIAQFADDTWHQFLDDDGNWLAVPFSFAPLGITYDSTQVSPTSYADILAPELQGQIGIPDVPGLHVMAASAALGLDPETLTPEELDQVIEFMTPVWGQARSISPSFGDIIGQLASGEIVAAYGGYPGLGAFTENPDILTVFPEEGTFAFVEVYSIPCDADNREGALAFINAMLAPETNAVINDAFAQATTITASIDLISDANKELYPYDGLDAFFEENLVHTLPSGENGVGMGEFIEAYAALTAGG